MDFLDFIYIGLFGVVFGILLVIETQIKQIKTMMEEHVKCDIKKPEIN